MQIKLTCTSHLARLFNMSGGSEFDLFQSLSIELRIIDKKKKSSYKVHRLKEFPVVESLDEFRLVIERYFPDITANTNYEFGYFGERNKKFWVKTETELVEAYSMAIDGCALWINPYEGCDTEKEKETNASKPSKRE